MTKLINIIKSIEPLARIILSVNEPILLKINRLTLTDYEI